MLLASVLAGCLGDDSDEPEHPEPTDSPEEGESPSPDEKVERDLRFDLTEDDEVDAPSWGVGDWFQFEFDYHGAGLQAEEFDAVVVENRSDSWLLATDNRRISKEHSLWQMPQFLGDIRKVDLGTTGRVAQWDWLYEFPIHHNKTWEADMESYSVSGQTNTIPLTMNANYTADIEAPRGGRPGFVIEARSDGYLIAKYDYVPDIGWFSQLLLSSPNPDNWLAELKTKDHGADWNGSYYVHEAELVFQHTNTFPPSGSGQPVNDFLVADDAALVSGYIGVLVDSGAQEVKIEPPEGEPVQASVFSPAGVAIHEERFEVDAEGGTWDVLTPGVGMFTFATIDAWQIWEDRFEL